MDRHASAVLAAIRSQPWAILPEYLEAIEAIALRALDARALEQVAADGHEGRLSETRLALAAVGRPLPGSAMSTLRDGVAVIPVLGPIFPRANAMNSSAGGTSLDAIMRDLRVAEASAEVERTVMLFDTPGGVVSGVGEATAALRAATKPLTAYVSGMAASLGYWLASQASSIAMDPAASVGSIGAMMTVTRQVQPGADGRREWMVTSSNAPLKRADPESDEGRAELQAIVDAAEAVFIDDVAMGRRTSADTVKRTFGRGGMVAAKDAISRGMADELSTLEAMLGTPSRRTGTSRGYRRAEAELDLRRRAANRS